MVVPLFAAINLLIDADDAFDSNEGPDYDGIDAAIAYCNAALARRPNATGPLIDAAKEAVQWNVADGLNRGNVDWDGYDAVIDACRQVVCR